jgi:ESF2/ABP1 family protein
MSTRKRNEWLDAEESEDEEQGYDSAEESKTKALPGRALKRRKLDDDSDEGLSDNADDAATDQETAAELSRAQDKDPTSTEEPKKSKSKTKAIKPLTEKGLLASQKAASKTGVIYLSRVPPFMKPSTVKHLLSQYGEIGRIFLTPEDPASHTRRVKAGGNKKRSFTDGWVEFLSKKDAKLVAETLNAQTIGGKKGGWYHDDLWNIKYLKGFKWHHLTEQIANENAERAARLRAEISQTTRENKMFLDNVERAKMLDGMAAKRKKKLGDAEDQGAPIVAAHHRREFRQNKVKSKSNTDQGEATGPLLRL